MKTIELNPNQIITLNDYPLHSDGVLSEYFTKCKIGKDVPFVPVIRKDTVRKYFGDKLLEEFERFERQNPFAEYFMLDGSHRTTALTLAGCKIRVIIYERDADIKEAGKLVATGQILKNEILAYLLEENCRILHKHFKEKPYFMTVEQKAEKMVKEKILPQNMIKYYSNLHQV
ncbi:hypothetical protein HY643_03760 [Candidatus Woesearchaeota archaeon]|nr:hypothetical protein [Candidatus Woesearchaeota archaeon]